MHNQNLSTAKRWLGGQKQARSTSVQLATLIKIGYINILSADDKLKKVTSLLTILGPSNTLTLILQAISVLGSRDSTLGERLLSRALHAKRSGGGSPGLWSELL